MSDEWMHTETPERDYYLLLITLLFLPMGVGILWLTVDRVLDLRELQRTPLVEANEVLPGPVAIQGTIDEIENPLTAPRTGRTVAYFRHRQQERRQDSDGDYYWRTIHTCSDFSAFSINSGGESIRVVPNETSNFDVEATWSRTFQQRRRMRDLVQWLAEGDEVDIVGQAVLTDSGVEIHLTSEEGGLQQTVITDRGMSAGMAADLQLLLPWLGIALILLGLAAGLGLIVNGRETGVSTAVVVIGVLMLFTLSVALSLQDLERNMERQEELVKATNAIVEAGLMDRDQAESLLQGRLEALELQRRGLPDRWLRNLAGAEEIAAPGDGATLNAAPTELLYFFFQLVLAVVLVVASTIWIRPADKYRHWQPFGLTLLLVGFILTTLLFSGVWSRGGVEQLFMAAVGCLLFLSLYSAWQLYSRRSQRYLDDVDLESGRLLDR